MKENKGININARVDGNGSRYFNIINILLLHVLFQFGESQKVVSIFEVKGTFVINDN